MTARRMLLIVGLIVITGVLPPALYWFLIGRVPAVSPEEARRRLAANQAVLLDVRTSEEFAAGHLDGAVHWPCDRIRRGEALPPALTDRELLVICASGWRSAWAARQLGAQGVPRAVNVLGGLQAWGVDTPRACPAAFVLQVSHPAPTTRPAAAFRPASALEQWVAVITGFVIKPIYMAGALVLAWILRSRRAGDLAALRWSMVFFFIGEAFCALNYLAFGERSYLFEYLHSFGMVLAFAFGVYAIFEFVDLRIVHYSTADQKCALLGLCQRCIKGSDVPCGLRRVFFLLIPATVALALIPLCATIRPTVYTTRILSTDYTYLHETVHQMYEFRFLPWLAVVLLAASLGVLWLKEQHPTPVSRVLFAAGIGALAFSWFRFVLLGTFFDNQVWFAAWEELTELIWIAGAASGLWIFRRPLLSEA